MRLEHWTNATEQGVHAARRLLAGDGPAEPFAPVPFVWSDQYDRKIQTRRAWCRPTPTCTSRTARTRSASSSRCSAGAGASSARSASTGPARSCSTAGSSPSAASWDDGAGAREHMSAQPKRARIFTLPFTLVVLSGLCYFTALAMLTPVLPDYVEKSLGHGSIAVGIAVGAFAVGAILAAAVRGPDRRLRRPDACSSSAARSSSRSPRRSTASCTSCGSSCRSVSSSGFGEAGFFVGAATMITDLSPVERRGEAVSYWSVAVYGGLSFGPVLGSVLHGYRQLRHGVDRVGRARARGRDHRPVHRRDRACARHRKAPGTCCTAPRSGRAPCCSSG